MANPKSQQFKLTKAHISADRFGGFDNKFFDVKNQVAEINIYESIEEPSLSGTIAIVDDKSLYELINFNGTERIKLEMAGLGKDTDPVFEKTFIMTNIVRQLKGNDSLVYTCLTLSMNTGLFHRQKDFVGLIVDVLMILLKEFV